MIKQETVTIGNKQFIYTYSDTNHYIVRGDGVEYCEAYDPLDKKREYTESKNEIEVTEVLPNIESE
jgi:hypothetical protein